MRHFVNTAGRGRRHGAPSLLLLDPSVPWAYRLLETLLRVLEIEGCRNFSATMTRMAMKARMRAYSTMPWPSSARARSWATRACAVTICLVTNSLMKGTSGNSAYLSRTLLFRAVENIVHDARA